MYELVTATESEWSRRDCSEILQQVCENLREEGFKVRFFLVGSGACNLVTRNGNDHYDLDYNLEIEGVCDYDEEDLRRLKERVRVALNWAMSGTYFRDAHDSTSVLTAYKYFLNGVTLSFDVAIITKNAKGTPCILKHNKNAYVDAPLRGSVIFGAQYIPQEGQKNDQYTWNEIPSACNVAEKEKEIKNKGKWQKVRERYVELKNMYLRRGDEYHPSFTVYVEAVNQIYDTLVQNVSVISPAPAPSPVPPAKTLAKTKDGISPKTVFNCQIQQALSKAKKYNNNEISYVAHLACEWYDKKKEKSIQEIHSGLVTRFGQSKGTEIYNRIVQLLK